jgi:hypothetical protein
MNNNKGSVLILTFLFMTTAVVITMAYLSMVRYDTILVDSQSNAVHALYIAEAGLNKAAWYLLNIAPDNTTDGSWRTLAYPTASGSDPADPQEESFAGGAYTIWVEDSGGDILLTSRGVYNGVTRIVHQQENMIINPPDPRMLVAVAGSWGVN